MSYRTLIVARLNPGDADQVAKVFADSDATDLPYVIGVERRTLFQFHDLYFHLVEAQQDITPNLYRVRESDEYRDIHEKLARYISPYSPTWREPRDAMAAPFYTWSAR